MAAAAVTCSLLSRGCLNVPSVSAQSSVVRNSNSGSCQLVWNPRRSRSDHLSSFSAASSSGALSRKFTETQRSPRLRSTVPRARSEDDEGSEQETIIDGESNVFKTSESEKNVWSQFLTSAAKPAVVAVMMAVLLAQPVEDSFAASSGGRMGGKAFSAPRPSAPSRSGGGGGGGGRAYSGGGGGGGIYVAPPLYGSPYGYSPFGYSPFYGGGYGGGGMFLGPPIGFGGGGTIILAMIAFATVRAVIGFIRDRFSGDEDDDRFDD